MIKSQRQIEEEESLELSESDFADHKNQINVGAIALAVGIVVIILVIVYFIKTYANQKVYLEKILNAEISSIEKGMQNSLHYNNYILDILSDEIRPSSKHLKEIHRRLKFYHRSPELNNNYENGNLSLNWHELVWVDKDGKARVGSVRGIIDQPSAISKSTLEYSKAKSGKKVYWADSFNKNGKSIIYTLRSLQNEHGKFLGNIAIGFNGEALIKSLARHRINHFTHFVIFDREYNVIVQSQKKIDSAGISEGKVLNETTKENLLSIKLSDKNSKPKSFIDMMRGINYNIKKMDRQPFFLLVTVDKYEISQMMFNSVVIKFIEIAIFASMFLILIVTIYKRETMFRINAEKAYLSAKKANKAKSDFLAFTAHEIRSPLGFIMTGSEIMCKKMFGPISEKYLEYLHGIHNSSKIILDFIDDILNEEQILAGNFKIVESYVSVVSILNEAIKLNKSRYAHKVVTINMNHAKQLPKVYCDFGRIMQVFNNIISNSIKYTDGNPTIDIEVSMLNGELVIVIQDYGVGMSEEEIKIALTKFGIVHQRQAHTSLIQQFGLGLAIVKLLLDAHETTFQVESQVRRGTKVTISFPSDRLQKQPKKPKRKAKGKNEKK